MRKATSVLVVSLIFACLASSASAAVQAGVVGGAGIHNQYGPQNAGGDYLGIASESYEALTDWEAGFWEFVAAQTTPDGFAGFVLLAFDPYTGEVWSQVPDDQQALGGAGSYVGHAPTVGLSDVDGGGDPISSDVAVQDMGRGYTDDTIFITTLFADFAPYYQYGMSVHTSPDGGLLAGPGPVSGERGLLYGGEEIRPYGAGEALPVYDAVYAGLAQDFSYTTAQAYNDWWYAEGETSVYAGHNGEGGLFGFEMDGIRGWMQLDFSPGAGAGGVRLTEYYFDLLTLGDFDGDGDVDADDIDILCDNLGDAAYDLDGDLDADEDDMIFLIETLVELTDGVRVGTKRGDFNLNGLIDETDLALMKTSFGLPGMGFADGNANCDAFVDGTDLAILKTNFGFIALPSPGGVPEPASAALMLIVGGFLVRRKRRALA